MNKLSEYFEGDELAIKIWKDKYCMKDKAGKPLEETPDDMHRRMAKEFAKQNIKTDMEFNTAPSKLSALSPYGRQLFSEYAWLDTADLALRYYNLFKDFKYIIPQGSVMAQLGTPTLGSLSNCVVMGQPHDSYGGIMRTDEQLAQLFKRRCGVGIDISSLRPENTATNNAARSTTGAISFMHRFSNTTREVAQNGRRGALMVSMDVNHLDILDFIKIKRDLTQVTGANISIKLNDEFMRAVEADGDYWLKFPCNIPIHLDMKNERYEYNVLNKFESPEVGTFYLKKVKAKDIWDELIDSAHGVAEPGIMNWDTMVHYSPDSVYPQYIQITTNPCSEIAMQDGDSCRLIVVNLLSFVEHPFTDKAWFNVDKFYKVNYEALIMNDDLVDLEAESILRIQEKIKNDIEPEDIKRVEFDTWQKLYDTGLETRRVGLGITALGDTLAALGLKYDSDEALEAIELIFSTKMKSDLNCTIDLAIMRAPFKAWNANNEFAISHMGTLDYGFNKFYQFILENFPEEAYRMAKYGRRNLSWSTCAPTGSLSNLTKTSSGIEPVFLAMYKRRVKINPGDNTSRIDFVDDSGDSWQEIPVLHPQFRDWCKLNTPDFVVEDFGAGNFNLKDVDTWSNLTLEAAFKKSPWYNSTANDIDWQKRVKVQATIQKYISHSISSTINLPETVSKEVVNDIYMEAWKQGIKGITVYRDNCRSGVLVANDEAPKLTTFNETHAPRRPKKVAAKVVKFNNDKERWVAFVGLIDNKPYEIFTGKLGDMNLPAKVEIGYIVKIKEEDGTKRYDFVYDGGEVPAISRISAADLWNYGKLISGMLRHGMPLPYAVTIINNLTFAADHINTWKNGIVRALKTFIKDGKVVGIKCNNPECTGDKTNVIFENGCSRCLDCGDTKCS